MGAVHGVATDEACAACCCKGRFVVCQSDRLCMTGARLSQVERLQQRIQLLMHGRLIEASELAAGVSPCSYPPCQRLGIGPARSALASGPCFVRLIMSGCLRLSSYAAPHGTLPWLCCIQSDSDTHHAKAYD